MLFIIHYPYFKSAILSTTIPTSFRKWKCFNSRSFCSKMKPFQFPLLISGNRNSIRFIAPVLVTETVPVPNRNCFSCRADIPRQSHRRREEAHEPIQWLCAADLSALAMFYNNVWIGVKPCSFVSHGFWSIWRHLHFCDSCPLQYTPKMDLSVAWITDPILKISALLRN